MFNRIALLAAAGAPGGACASNPAPAAARRSAPRQPAPSPLTPAAALRARRHSPTWRHDVLAGGRKADPGRSGARAGECNGATNADSRHGVVVACNAANGTHHDAARQAGRRAASGRAATFKLRAGASARDIEGKFETNRRSPDADFVFPITSADLLAMGQLDMVSFVSDRAKCSGRL